IDLAAGGAKRRELAREDLGKFIGGSSLAAWLLYPKIAPGLDPLSSDAPLLFITGPLTGTKGPAVGRYVVCAKSPATGLWGESNIGGFFGAELRAAGIDALLITGRAPAPVYLWIDNGAVEIRSSDHLWNKTDTYQTQESIRKELGDERLRVACIGLAGETQLPFAGVLCDRGRAAGRTGMGAVMGSKLLKAIAVRGRQKIPLADEEGFGAVRSRVNVKLRDDNVSRMFREIGTGSGADYFDYLGEMPKRYFTRGMYEGVASTTGSVVSETILSGISTCHGCVIACGRRVRLSDGKERKGPEYETTVGFGPNLLVSDLEAITMMGEWCDRYGMDVISLSNTIGLAILLSEEGVLPAAPYGEGKLRWGDAAMIERLIHKTARREGLGELLALGARGLAQHFGVAGKAVQVNGLEVAYHDPRGSSGMALVYATSPRGACHNQSDFFMVDVGQSVEEVGVDFMARHAGEEKAGNVARHQDWRTVSNALVMCYFANVPAADVIELLNLATGFDFGLEELMRVGERAWNLKRMINWRLGLRRKNDRLPAALITPYREGGSAGYTPPLEEMLGAYYRERGWNPESGRPTEERLRLLGLEMLLDDIDD
ncbi:MAG: aldehyde ferredoxin oxidoreductase family protein, partial [Anaerolineales bacterium]